MRLCDKFVSTSCLVRQLAVNFFAIVAYCLFVVHRWGGVKMSSLPVNAKQLCTFCGSTLLRLVRHTISALHWNIPTEVCIWSTNPVACQRNVTLVPHYLSLFPDWFGHSTKIMHAFVRVCACVVSVFKDAADCRRVSLHSWCLIIFPLPFHLCSCFPLLTFRSNLVRQTDHRCPAEASHTQSAWPLGKPARFIFVRNSSGLLLSSTPFSSLLVDLMFCNWTRRAIKTLWTATLIFLVRYF